VEYRYEAGGREYVVRVAPAGEDLRVTVDGRESAVRVAAQRGSELVLEIEGEGRVRLYVAAEGARRGVALDPAATSGPGAKSGSAAERGPAVASGVVVLSVPQEAAGRRRRGGAAGHDALEALMPGVVRRVLVAAGEAVERGQVLLLLEAMKMEMRVTAPHAGRVEAVAVREGQAVERGQALVDLVSG
jgi:biotin carboxyl carrier protein